MVSFATRVDFATGASPVAVSIGDLDGDGKPDLAIANNYGNTVSIIKQLSASALVKRTITNSLTAKLTDFTEKTGFTISTNPVVNSSVSLRFKTSHQAGIVYAL